MAVSNSPVHYCVVKLDLTGKSPEISGAGGGGRTHMPSEGRGILSPVRLPVPPLQQEGGPVNLSIAYAAVSAVAAPLTGGGGVEHVAHGGDSPLVCGSHHNDRGPHATRGADGR